MASKMHGSLYQFNRFGWVLWLGVGCQYMLIGYAYPANSDTEDTSEAEKLNQGLHRLSVLFDAPGKVA